MKNQKYKLKIKNTNAFLIFGLCFLFLILSFSFSFAQTKTLKNIGFIQNNIWYSRDPFFEGNKIRIYTAVFNGSQYDFRGTLEFFVYPDVTGRVGGKSIGKSNFSLVSGAFQVLWADWVAEGGSKKIYANIIEPKISLPGGVEELVILENSKTGEIETFVDKDTDKDGVGDKIDVDDDNDNVSDAIEQKQNTNPLVSEKFPTEIPEPQKVAESAKGIVVSINNFLDEQKEKVEVKKKELQKKLEKDESLFEFDFGSLLGNGVTTEVGAQVSSEDGAGKNKNLLKLYLLALSALIFSLEYKVIIYLFGIYIAYRILKFFMKKIFFWHVDKF